MYVPNTQTSMQDYILIVDGILYAFSGVYILF